MNSTQGINPLGPQDEQALIAAIQELHKAIDLAERCRRCKMNMDAPITDCKAMCDQAELIRQEFLSPSQNY